MLNKIFILLIIPIFIFAGKEGNMFEKDMFKTTQGDLVITFIGHATLMLAWNGKVIHVDPVSDMADYDKLPKADIILVTHEHFDHFDIGAINKIKKNDTTLVYTQLCQSKMGGGKIMKNGDHLAIGDINIDAIPAYNIKHMRSPQNPFHPQGNGNGYIIFLGQKRILVGGDTENIPEIKSLKNIDIAFLPMNLPYTMTPEMVAETARAFRPKILYPYHFGETDTNQILNLLKNEKDIEVRIRPLK